MSTLNWTAGDWIKVIGGCSLTIALSAYFYSVCDEPKVLPDLDEYGCVVGQPITAHTLILADMTDPYSNAQILCFHTKVEEVIASSPPGGMVSIATIAHLPPDFIAIRCSPIHVDAGADMWSHPDESWVQINARYYNAFVKPLHDLEGGMSFNKTEPYSPIFQTLEQAVQHLGRHWSDAKERHVILFSDLMEHTKAYSQYSTAADLNWNHVATRVPYFSRPINLERTSVEAFYLTGLAHDQPHQGELHKEFWRDALTANGATVQFFDLPASKP